jgi:hypothetical protein
MTQSCPNCSNAITEKNKKVKNPCVYVRGKKKGTEKKCCKNPDWRECGGKDCDEGNILCLNCGGYYGFAEWWCRMGYEKLQKIRTKLLRELKEKDMLKIGYVKIWRAFSYTLLLEYNQEELLIKIHDILESSGICPLCLKDMDTERYGDAAGGMDTRYVCKCREGMCQIMMAI